MYDLSLYEYDINEFHIHLFCKGEDLDLPQNERGPPRFAVEQHGYNPSLNDSSNSLPLSSKDHIEISSRQKLSLRGRVSWEGGFCAGVGG